MTPKRHLFFIPHHGVWPIALHEHQVGRAIAAAGNEVVALTCEGTLSAQCLVMDSLSLKPDATAEKAKACYTCNLKRRAAIKQSGFREILLGSLLDSADLQEIDESISRLDPKAVTEFTFRGYPAGLKCLFDTLIQFKKIDLEFNSEEFAHYRGHLLGGMRTIVAAEKILTREKFDSVVVYSSHASAAQCLSEVARSKGLPTWNLHSGLAVGKRFESMIFGRDSNKTIRLRIKEKWPEFRDSPSTPGELEQCTAEVVDVIRSASVYGYSPPTCPGHQVNVREYFGVRAEQKLVTVTMSSYDEMFSSELLGYTKFGSKHLFATQIEWVEFLLDHARKRPDLFLLVRVHPREFPNKRESVLSYHAQMLQKQFQNLPSNAAINWPTDKFSIFDVAKFTDLFLNAWSSAGVDMSLLGIPVLTYSKEIIFYPQDLNYSANSRDEYVSSMDRALAEGWSETKIRDTFRWLVFLWIRAHFHTKGPPISQRLQPYRLARGANRVFARASGIPLLERLDMYSLPPLLAQDAEKLLQLLESDFVTKVDLIGPNDGQSRIADLESEALRKTTKVIYSAMYGSDFDAPQGSLGARLRAAFA